MVRRQAPTPLGPVPGSAPCCALERLSLRKLPEPSCPVCRQAPQLLQPFPLGPPRTKHAPTPAGDSRWALTPTREAGTGQAEHASVHQHYGNGPGHGRRAHRGMPPRRARAASERARAGQAGAEGKPWGGAAANLEHTAALPPTAAGTAAAAGAAAAAMQVQRLIRHLGAERIRDREVNAQAGCAAWRRGSARKDRPATAAAQERIGPPPQPPISPHCRRRRQRCLY